MIDTLRLTAEGAIALLERREVSAAELHAAYLDAIAERDGELHCYLRTSAEASGEGIPIALKDVISTKGIETTAGSKILSGYTPVFDATVAARVKRAGLSLLGKTNTDEFAMGSSTENSAWGPTRNPWDPTRVPGGSGGGTAAAVSAGLAPWGLDRTRVDPSSKPSAPVRERRSTADLRDGLALRRRRVRVEPRPDRACGEDCARRRASVLDHRGPRSARLDDRGATGSGRLPESDSLAGVRLAVPKQVDLDAIEPGVRAAFQQSLDRARELGAEVGECDLPLAYRYGMPCYYLVAPAEASSNLARYDGVRYGLRTDATTYDDMVERTRDDGFGAEPKRGSLGTYARGRVLRRVLRPGAAVRTLLIREHREAAGFDAIATPTSPTVASRWATRRRIRSPCTRAISSRSRRVSQACPGSRSRAACPRGSRRASAHRAAVRRERLFRIGHALEQAIGFDTVPERLR